MLVRNVNVENMKVKERRITAKEISGVSPPPAGIFPPRMVEFLNKEELVAIQMLV